jgi:phosphoglycolate phosphatase-like HAD superfamily hydrolase
MFQAAQRIYGNLPQVMIGDSDSDIQAAKLVGVHGLKTKQKDFQKIASDWLEQ